MIRIDGSFGEGGGQVIRTAITLAAILGKPIRIENIRKKRKNPGLRPQHLTAVKILGKICNAEIEGLHIGSTSVMFKPNPVTNCILREDVGTAGSMPLILQVLIPIISICGKNLELHLVGGTDVLWSPTYDYTNFVLREAYRRMGIEFQVNIERRGYYPKGGGRIYLSITKGESLRAISLTNRTTKKAKLVCSYSELPNKLIELEILKIKTEIEANGFLLEIEVNRDKSISSGGSLLIYSVDENSIIGVDTIFDQKSNAFSKDITKDFLSNKFGVDDNLSDMIVLPASLASGTTVFRVNHLTKHLETNLYVVAEITGCRYGIGKLNDGYEIRIEGISYSRIQ